MLTYPDIGDTPAGTPPSAELKAIMRAGIGAVSGTGDDITDPVAFRNKLYLQAVPINVKEFGATGDGVTDDSAAIQSAITAAASAEKAVYLPRGIYKCNLVLGATAATSAIRLFGAGNGSTGDWATTESAGATMLIPNNDALPIIKIEALKGIKIEDMEIRGNGAGITTTGLLIDAPAVNFAGNGLIVDNVNIRKCTYNIRNLGGCNMSFKQCGIFQGNYGFYVDNLPLAHSYTFDLCSIGGLAATGTSRCFHVEDGSFLNIINCEQGNCTDYLYMSGAPVVVILGGNWETYSAQELINMLGGTLTITGGRWSTGGKTILRVNGGAANILAVTMIGLMVSGDQTVFETNNWNSPVIRGVGQGKRVKVWNSDFTSLIGESINERLSASGRLTVGQAVAGVGTHVIVFNVATLNVGSKYSTSTGRFTPGKVGRYHISASARISGVPGGYAGLVFRINGTSYATANMLTSGGAGTVLSGSGVFALDANDYLEVAIICGGALNIDSNDNYTTQFFIEELSNH